MAYYEGITNQPAEVMRFLSAITVDGSTNNLLVNELDYKLSFISRFYTPNMKVSSLSSIVKNRVDNSDTTWVNNLNSIDEDSLISLVDSSNLKVQYPSIYQTMQGLILEAFSIGYAETQDWTLYEYLSDADLANVLNTIEYLLDALATLAQNNDDEYLEIINILTGMYSNISSVKSSLHGLKARTEDNSTIY